MKNATHLFMDRGYDLVFITTLATFFSGIAESIYQHNWWFLTGSLSLFVTSVAVCICSQPKYDGIGSYPIFQWSQVVAAAGFLLYITLNIGYNITQLFPMHKWNLGMLIGFTVMFFSTIYDIIQTTKLRHARNAKGELINSW